jgi:hypothetical protein
LAVVLCASLTLFVLVFNTAMQRCDDRFDFKVCGRVVGWFPFAQPLFVKVFNQALAPSIE